MEFGVSDGVRCFLLSSNKTNDLSISSNFEKNSKIDSIVWN